MKVTLGLGLGCDCGPPPATTITRCIAQALASCGLGVDAVRTVASIDLKADEPGLLAVIEDHGWPSRFYPASALAAVDVPNPSETVRKYTGTPSVSEAAALLAANAEASHLLIEKHKLRGPDGRNATVSIARIPQ